MAMLTSPSACIAADPEQIAKVVLFPGDPLRARALAETYLQNPVCFNEVRNMLGYTGIYKGRQITVMGSGMGIPSATLYAHELFNYYGVERIIRMGTTGAVADDLKVRDIVVAMTASTNSRFADQYEFPGQLAPAADYDMVATAVRCGAAAGLRVRVGSVFTGDMFYNLSPNVNEKCRDMGILAVDMETAGLYWEAMASKKRALSIMTVSNHILHATDTSMRDRQDGFTEMMELALETAWTYAEE